MSSITVLNTNMAEAASLAQRPPCQAPPQTRNGNQ